MNEIATQGTDRSTSAVLFDPTKLQALTSFAELMSRSIVSVPEHLRGKPSDCLAITMQAMRWGMDPFVVAQKTCLINGRLSYEAQLVIAVLKNSGAVVGRPHYEYEGRDASLSCRAGFVPAGETQIVWTEWIRHADVKVQNSPLWKTNPAQQLGYLQARNWARLYAPEALLGVYTSDEIEVVDQDAPGSVQKQRVPASSGTAQRVEERPVWPAESFAANLTRWGKAVSANLKTVDDILTIALSKGDLTPEQRAQILALRVADAAEAQPAATTTTTTTTTTAAEEEAGATA